MNELLTNFLLRLNQMIDQLECTLRTPTKQSVSSKFLKLFIIKKLFVSVDMLFSHNAVLLHVFLRKDRFWYLIAFNLNNIAFVNKFFSLRAL